MKQRAGAALCAAIAVAVLGTASTTALAQQSEYMRLPHRVHVFVDGGIGIPAQPGTFNHYWNTTFPFTIGVGVPIFAWLDINGAFTYAKFGNNSLASKDRIGIVGTQEVTGGAIQTTMFFGTARFLAVPSARANPYMEVGVGVYKVTAEQLEVEETLINTMNDESGIMVSLAPGIQYALNDHWSAYSKFMWTINLSDTFAPHDLILRPGEAPAESGENMMIATFVVGMLLRF